MDRSPKDGKPYYCDTCGAGWGEYIACSEPDCELEPKWEAEARAAANALKEKQP